MENLFTVTKDEHSKLRLAVALILATPLMAGILAISAGVMGYF